MASTAQGPLLHHSCFSMHMVTIVKPQRYTCHEILCHTSFEDRTISRIAQRKESYDRSDAVAPGYSKNNSVGTVETAPPRIFSESLCEEANPYPCPRRAGCCSAPHLWPCRRRHSGSCGHQELACPPAHRDEHRHD